MSSPITELGKNRSVKKIREKLHNTDYGRRTSSAITELGKRTGR